MRRSTFDSTRLVAAVLVCAWTSPVRPAMAAQNGQQSASPSRVANDQQPAAAPTGQKPTPTRISADTHLATPGGATFTAPAGWSVVSGDAAVVLETPEPDSHVAIVDVHAADA